MLTKIRVGRSEIIIILLKQEASRPDSSAT